MIMLPGFVFPSPAHCEITGVSQKAYERIYATNTVVEHEVVTRVFQP